MKKQELKTKVIKSLKAKGYHESQLNELNPIIESTINATKQALNLHFVSQRSELLLAFFDYYEREANIYNIPYKPIYIESFLKANNCG